MKTLYFDCFSGISGDMTVAALIDLGCDLDYLRSELRKLPLKDFELHLSRVERASISAAKFDVEFEAVPDRGHTHRNAFEIIEMIQQSQLRPAVRRRAVEILEKLAISEGQIHNVSPGKVEFHEVGAIDSIIDVVGAAIGFDFLGVEHFISSSVNLGAGFVAALRSRKVTLRRAPCFVPMAFDDTSNSTIGDCSATWGRLQCIWSLKINTSSVLLWNVTARVREVSVLAGTFGKCRAR